MKENWRVAPVLVVSNVESSMRYYRDRLDFRVIGTFGSPTEMAFVGSHDVQLMLQDSEGKPIPGPNARYKSIAWDALFWVDDARSLHDKVAKLGANVRKPPYVTFYGHTEFEAVDPDGYVLCFSQAPERRSPPTDQ